MCFRFFWNRLHQPASCFRSFRNGVTSRVRIFNFKLSYIWRWFFFLWLIFRLKARELGLHSTLMTEVYSNCDDARLRPRAAAGASNCKRASGNVMVSSWLLAAMEPVVFFLHHDLRTVLLHHRSCSESSCTTVHHFLVVAGIRNQEHLLHSYS